MQPASAAQRPLYTLAEFANAPFPYDGIVPETGERFLDVTANGRRGHASPRGGVYWEDETYWDRRSLLYMPPGFDPGRPATIVVFLHGNDATLERDVLQRQQVGAQLEASGMNAVLLAPQLAVDALDSSAGRFWQSGAFAAYLGEASDQFAALYGNRATAVAFDRMPVLIVAYSGGYLPAAYAVSVGGADRRICGLVLFDAVYGEEERFASWVARSGRFFFSAYSDSAADGNRRLEALVASRGIPFAEGIPRSLAPASRTFAPVSPSVEHDDFVTRAWRSNPLQWVLSQVAANGDCVG